MHFLSLKQETTTVYTSVTLAHLFFYFFIKVCEDHHPTSLFLKMVTPPPQKSSAEISVREMYKQFSHSPQGADFLFFLKQNTTDSVRKRLENLVQGENEWLLARECRITASIAQSVKTFSSITSCTSMLKAVLGTSANNFTSKDMEFGKEFEPLARELYRMKQEKLHKNFSVEERGLYVHKDYPYMGASPDGIVSCKCHPPRLLEIKCSAKHKLLHPTDIPSKDHQYHVDIVNDTLILKQKSPWYSQVQFQMGVTGFRVCDFVLYTNKDIAIIPIEFNQTMWDLLCNNSKEIFLQGVIPNLC